MTEENDIVIDPTKQMDWNFEYVKMLLAAVIVSHCGGEVAIDNSRLHKSYDIQLQPYFEEDYTGLKIVVREVESGDGEGLG